MNKKTVLFVPVLVMILFIASIVPNFIAPAHATANLALGKSAVASSARNSALAARYAVDGNTDTRWGSNYTSNEWIYIDLGAEQSIGTVKIQWGASYATGYKIQVSLNASAWTDVYSTDSGDGGIDELSFPEATAKYVRMLGVATATVYGYSVYELEVYGSESSPGTGSAPERTASYGPNGTHWPSLIPTPYMYDSTIPHIIDVSCSWTAIRSAIAAVTPGQAAAGVLIRIAPGTLTGNGVGAGNTPVLQDLGSSSWAQRITVAPRDGYGTVVLSGGIRIKNVRGVAFAGFVADKIKLEGCDSSALAWTKVTDWLAGYGLAGQTTSKLEFSEVVMPDSAVVDGDAADFYSATNGPIANWRFDGIYIAPHFYNPATTPKPHTDSMQFAGSAAYSNMTIRDAAIFSSNNCAIQTGSLNGLTIDHSYIVGGSVARSRYPFLPGGSTEAGTAAFNGGGTNFVAVDSVFIGGMGSQSWSSVANTRTSYVYQASQQPASGSWTVDPGLSSTNPAMPPMPTDAYLNSIWKE
ncbi:MAG: hypothetical protein K0R57_2570 [Paenibacillaceae bacterium]|nr:hypothetical protein [Paenibacillaceae bacterium]